MSGLVVLGASYAGIQTALTARDAGYAEPITVVADEDWLPYQRPPLSKAFLLDLAREESLVLRDRGFFATRQIDLLLGERATKIDPHAREVLLHSGARLAFDKLMIGTGSHARRLDIAGAELDGVCYLRAMNDAVDLRSRLRHAESVVVIGGGFIGLEVAASAIKLGKQVTLLEAAPRLLERAVSDVVSAFLLDMHRRHGVDVRLGAGVASIEGRGGKVASVTCADGRTLPADLVVVGIGGVANDQLAGDAGLACANGIMVDDHGGTTHPDIFAAGDCANHHNVFAGGRVRLESVQNAQDQAKAAGFAIAGRTAPYTSVPRFWSDQYDVKLQTVGLSKGFDALAIRGAIDDGKFSVFYYRGPRLIAVDSINRPGDQMAARRLIAEGLSPSRAAATDLGFDFKSLVAPANGADA